MRTSRETLESILYHLEGKMAMLSPKYPDESRQHCAEARECLDELEQAFAQFVASARKELQDAREELGLPPESLDLGAMANKVRTARAELAGEFDSGGVDPIAVQEVNSAVAALDTAEARLRIAETHQTRAVAAVHLGRYRGV